MGEVVCCYGEFFLGGVDGVGVLWGLWCVCMMLVRVLIEMLSVVVWCISFLMLWVSLVRGVVVVVIMVF